MRDVSHTHPYADEGALDRLFERGPVVAADGGERNAYDPDAREDDEASEQERDADAREEDDDEQDREQDADARAAAAAEEDRMKDVDHTPPHGEGVDRVFERGGEHSSAESEE